MGYNYNGFTYVPWTDVEEDECIKICHDVITPEGQRVHMDWSPYSRPTEADFQLWIALGLPTREQLGLNFNFDGRDLEAASQSLANETAGNRE